MSKQIKGPMIDYDFSDQDWSDYDFIGDFTGSNFTNCIMHNTKLIGDFTDCDFTGTRFGDIVREGYFYDAKGLTRGK